jgi:outer membrane protein assembly factor BamA
MPNFSYNTDLGLNLGAFCDFFYYGDGTAYPNFLHHAGFSASYATKGSWYAHAYLESVALIPGIRFSASATYRDALANNFYGYNGIASPFFEELELNAGTRTAWYTNRRRFFRASASFQGKIGPHLSWLGGAVFRHVRIGDFSLSNYDSGKSLYLLYHDLGLIRDDEFGGGTSLEFKGGLTYDTRDVELFPSKGAYAEAMLVGNTDLLHGRYNYLQLSLHWRHYLTLVPGRLIFAYHLGLQQTLSGDIPFYNLNELATLHYAYEEFSGLGSRYSVRGYRYTRISAAGYAWANLELRVIPLRFKMFNQNFHIVINPFMDLAGITKTYRADEQKNANPGTIAVFQDRKLPVMASAGVGGKLHMNTNFILSLDFAKGFNPQLSDFMVGMGTTYVF